MKILYLYAEAMGYTMAVIEALVQRGAEVHLIHWDHKKLTPYQMVSLPNVYIYKRSEMSAEEMKRLADNLDPVITYVSGWTDKGYLQVARRLKQNGKLVVAGLDGIWQGTFRQIVGSVIGGAGYFSRYFSHAWVAGPYQFEYARRLGFGKGHIIYDLYTADLKLFQEFYWGSIKQKKQNYPHRFLFVGRFEAVKGLDTLLKAWQVLGEDKRDWELHLVGNGSLRALLQSGPDLVVNDFMQPVRLGEEVANAGCFILPSRAEPWGVVVHEFAAAGLPLILSDEVGAASTFLISGMNGFRFEPKNPQALAERMRDIISLNNDKLFAMSEQSYRLSERITPESSAGNLLSCVNW